MKGAIQIISLGCMLFLFATVAAVAQEGKQISLKKVESGIDAATVGGDTIKGESAVKSVTLTRKITTYLEVDWVSPGTSTINVSTPFFDLQLKIFTSEPIRPEQIQVLVNGKPNGSKADEASLLGMKNEFTYKGRINLVPGPNKVEIIVTQGNTVKRSQAVTIIRSQSASPVSAGPPASFVYWLSPNPLELEGKPLVVKSPELELNLNLVADEPLDMSRVKILINDQPISPSARATLKGVDNRYNFKDYLSLNPQTQLYKVALKITSKGREYKSEPLLVNFSPFKPNLYLLSIGTQSNLQYATKDAQDVANLFRSQGGDTGNRLFGQIQVETLIGKDATAYNISRQMEKLNTKFATGNIDSSDLVMVFISTHGFIAENGEFRLQGNDFDQAARRTTSVSYRDDVLAVMDQLPCKKLIFIDACHSGGIDGSKAGPSMVNLEIEKLNRVKKGLTTIVSSLGVEQSYEDALWQNGAFTRGILDALVTGKADVDRNKIITIQELFTYISREVPIMVKRVKNQSQTPQLINNELGNVAIYILD